MSPFSVRVFDHNWERVLLPAGITFEPQTWDAEAVGGSARMEIQARGNITRLTELVNWLGYTIWIMSPDNEYVWWGDIEEVEIAHAGAAVGATLTEVANRLKVIYTDASPGGDLASAETDWVQDDDSIALYGLRERQHTAQAPMRAAQAEVMRDTLLERVSRPVPVIGQLAEHDETRATLLGTGFWRRMERVYYANDDGLTEYKEGSQAWPLGLGFTSTHVAAVNLDGKYHFHQTFGRFEGFDVDGLKFKVSGMTSGTNNSTFTVVRADTKEPVSITKTTITFSADDDIEESTYALTDFEPNDVIGITGSAANSGAHLVKTGSASHTEVSQSFAGGNIVAEAAGPAVTIVRGNSVEVEEVTANERTGASATVTAWGEMIAQSFVTGTSGTWVAASVEIKMRKQGAPTDGVYVRLKSDTAGSPGALLDSVLVDDADIAEDEQGRWTEFPLTGGVSLVPATTYWIEILRSGANDSENYYQVWLDDEGGYASGTLKLHDGTAYQTPSPAKSLAFRALGAVDTAQQVGAICASNDVFSEVMVLDTSGVETNQYRDGLLLASEEAGELLDTGDGSSIRLLASVNPQRWALIRTQPDASTAQYIWRDGSLYTLQGKPVSPGLLPVGEWCHLDNPALLNGALAAASPFFIEYASYTVNQGWSLRAAGEPDPWKMGEVRDG